RKKEFVSSFNLNKIQNRHWSLHCPYSRRRIALKNGPKFTSLKKEQNQSSNCLDLKVFVGKIILNKM
ncbi:1990_t:CDS:1, partial [Gigaspora rosea]